MAAASVGLTDLPAEYSPALLDDENVLRVMHHLLFDIHVMEGELICPESGHAFIITNGVPNMMYVLAHIYFNIII